MIDPKFIRNSPAKSSELAELEQEVGVRLPSDYVAFLMESDGGEGEIGLNYVMLWRASEIAELNRAYEVFDHVPGLLLFGSSGGGEAYAFDLRRPGYPIVRVPFVGMDLSTARDVADTFRGFVEALSASDRERST